ncbi:hypothetical protein B0I35DRAFT_512216 [Stachybotrys elegans]|uniref:MARVEL domain-containing protein n=1 Tax=Stachybotrys elegans TaxID=80388 RepID=A0A8K0SRT6_9HYPO|nr:hypothetical protein B0I35DRAFT_512216 [Stachybotrys elegans]
MSSRGVGRGLTFLQLFLRLLQNLSALVVLSITAYALATSDRNGDYTDGRHYSVVGIAAVAFVYSVLAAYVLRYLSLRNVTSFLTVMFDLAFVGAFIFVAVVHRYGSTNCDAGNLRRPNTRVSCQLQKAVLATSISAILLFLLSVPTQIGLMRNNFRQNRHAAASEAKLEDPDAPDAPEPVSSGSSGGGFFSNLFRRATTRTTRTENALPSHPTPEEAGPGPMTQVNETPDNFDGPYAGTYDNYPPNNRHGYGQVPSGPDSFQHNRPSPAAAPFSFSQPNSYQRVDTTYANDYHHRPQQTGYGPGFGYPTVPTEQANPSDPYDYVYDVQRR